jgi:hypothetical protein
MNRFTPRVITRVQAEQGYNNECRGELIGYLSEPEKHDATCRYRITCDGNRDNPSRKSCTCRLGLWREKTVTQKVVDDIRKTAKRSKKPKTKTVSKPKAKPHKKRKATSSGRGR